MLRQPEIPGPTVQVPTVRRETEPRRTRISDICVRVCAMAVRNSACTNVGERERGVWAERSRLLLVKFEIECSNRD